MLRKLGIEPGEGRLFAWGTGALLLVGWADVSLKNASEVFFVKRVGVQYLPLAFLASSLLLVATTYGVARLASRRDRLRLLPRALAFMALLLIPLWLLARSGVGEIFALLVVASKQFEAIALLLFFVAMGDLIHGRQAKRLFAPLMGGLTLGTIGGSFASEPLGRWLGLDGLVPVSAVALALAAAATLPLRRLARVRLDPGARMLAPPSLRPAPAESAPGLRELWRRSSLFRLLFTIVICSGLLGPMLYFQFQFVADLATTGAGAEQKLLSLYAQLRGWIYLGILVAQLGVSSSLYRRIGVPMAAAISPLIYLLGFLGLSVRLSLPAGVGAMAATKLQDDAVYDPALRVLFNLFPERLRPSATTLLEGPLKRSGGALGNVMVLGAFSLGSAPWVGYAALPIAAFWLVVAVALWRRYPRLLIQASARRGRGEVLDLEQMLDPVTVRLLSRYLLDPDPARCRAATDLLAEAPTELAVGAFARAAAEAPASSRPFLVAAMDRLLERAERLPSAQPEALRGLEQLLEHDEGLGVQDRADVIQAYGRLTRGDAGEPPPPLERALADAAPAVRLAALAQLHQRGDPRHPARDLDVALETAVASDDFATRRTAREELRSLLMRSETGTDWGWRLALLVRLLEREQDRADAAEAVADVASKHGPLAGVAAEAMLALRDDPDPRVRAAVMRFAGRAGLHAQAGWLVEHVASRDAALSAAARGALRALGPHAADVLIVELSFGKRSKRDAILPLVRELEVPQETLRDLYERELDAIRRARVHHLALRGDPGAAIVRQRLQERADEGTFTALLYLAAMHGEARIADLGELLRRAAGGRQRAILVEALEALLPPQHKAELIPLLEEWDREGRERGAAAAFGVAVPSREAARRELLEDADELTRTVAAAIGADVAGPDDFMDHDRVLNPVEIAVQIKSLPLFEGLTTRQLMDLATVVQEVDHPPGTKVVSEGEFADCMFVIVDGTVRIVKGDTVLGELGRDQFFGEMAVIEGSTRSATAVTTTRTRMLCLRRDDLLRLMEDLPAIAIGICQALSRRVRELSERVG